MNDVTPLSLLLYAYSFLLVVAAVQDIKTLRISNVLSVAVLVAAIASVAVRSPPDWPEHLLSLVLVFASTYALFAFGWFGGGDTKLLTAAAVWFNLEGLMILLPAVLMIGGLVALAFIIVRRLLPRSLGETWVSLKKRGPIPYGVPISAGAIAAAFWVA